MSLASLSRLIVIVLIAVPALAQRGRVDWELRVGDGLRGPVVRGAVQEDGVWLATYGELYRVVEGKPRVVSRQPREEARLQLAPGGRVFAWVQAAGTPGRAFARVSLHRTDGGEAVTFETEPALGPDELILGFQGELILTFAPLDDPEGGRGRFRYTFWDRTGRKLNSVTLEKAIAILAADGSAVALLTEKEASVFSSAGEAVWRLAGSFRKGALSGRGARAALNPTTRQSLSEVVLVEGGQSQRTLKLPTAVHHLAISPAGDLVVAAGDRGRYFVIEGERLREGRALRSDQGTPYIFDLELAGPDSILLGILYRRGEKPPTWPVGGILGVRRNGAEIFRHDFKIEQATGFIPGIDVNWGDQAFVGYTREAVILGLLAGRR